MKKHESLLDVNRSQYLTLFIISVLGLSIRLLFLGSKSLWLDEANSLRVALLGQEMLWAGQTEVYHPPLFYWLFEWWSKLGQSEFVLRLFAVIPAALSIPALFVLGKDWFGKDVAMTSAALMAFSPLLVWYSQEARPYALLCLLGLLIFIAVNRLFQQPNVWRWLLFATAMTAVLYLHYFAVLLIPIQGLLFIALLASKRSTWRAVFYWLAGLAAVVWGFMPWLKTPGFRRFVEISFTERNYAISLLVNRLGVSTAWKPILVALAAAVFLLGAVVLYYLFRLPRTRLGVYLQDLPNRKWAQVAALVLFLFLLVISVIPRAHSLKRQLVLFWPYVLLFFGWFWPWRARYKNVLAGMLLLSFIAAMVNVTAVPKPQWRDVNAYIMQHQQENDLVLLEPSYMTIPFDYYNGGQSNQLGVGFGYDPAELQTLLQENGRIWLVIHEFDKDPQQENRIWLDEHADLTDTAVFYRLHVQLYER